MEEKNSGPGVHEKALKTNRGRTTARLPKSNDDMMVIALETPPCGNQRPRVHRNEKYINTHVALTTKASGLVAPGHDPICLNCISHSDVSCGWFAQGRGSSKNFGACQRQEKAAPE